MIVFDKMMTELESGLNMDKFYSLSESHISGFWNKDSEWEKKKIAVFEMGI